MGREGGIWKIVRTPRKIVAKPLYYMLSETMFRNRVHVNLFANLWVTYLAYFLYLEEHILSCISPKSQNHLFYFTLRLKPGLKKYTDNSQKNLSACVYWLKGSTDWLLRLFLLRFDFPDFLPLSLYGTPLNVSGWVVQVSLFSALAPVFFPFHMKFQVWKVDLP